MPKKNERELNLMHEQGIETGYYFQDPLAQLFPILLFRPPETPRPPSPMLFSRTLLLPFQDKEIKEKVEELIQEKRHLVRRNIAKIL